MTFPPWQEGEENLTALQHGAAECREVEKNVTDAPCADRKHRGALGGQRGLGWQRGDAERKETLLYLQVPGASLPCLLSNGGKAGIGGGWPSFVSNLGNHGCQGAWTLG